MQKWEYRIVCEQANIQLINVSGVYAQKLIRKAGAVISKFPYTDMDMYSKLFNQPVDASDDDEGIEEIANPRQELGRLINEEWELISHTRDSWRVENNVIYTHEYLLKRPQED